MRALIAMSGGVDSSAAAQLMAAQGWECIGCTMQLFFGDSLEEKNTENAGDARSVAEQLGIPFYVFHFEDQFREKVITPFIKEYLQARTPNPCVECNRCLKFGALFQKMKELGCDCLVTGHYARIQKDENSGRYLLYKAADPAKDQSYVLYSMTQEELAHTWFPLGEMTKKETREVAENSGFRNAKRKESQDICFIPDGDYAAFILRQMEKDSPGLLQEDHLPGTAPGDFIDSEGNVLGRHKGIIHYTLGQRRGLGIPAASRLYVTDIDSASNTVVLSTNEALFKRELTAEKINLIDTDRIIGERRAAAKIRYRHKEQPCTVTQPTEDTLHIVFDEPQRAITPGQSVVLYEGDKVIGGGVIKQPY